MITRICEYCGTEFKTYRAWIRGGKAGKYCSKLCMHKGHPRRPMNLIKLKCVVCNTEYAVRKYREKISKCCSMECLHVYIGRRVSGSNHPNWMGGIAGRPHKSKVWRRWVLERDGYRCIKCGISDIKQLRAHHIKSWLRYPKLRYDINNGTTLCVDCHTAAHPELKIIR